MLLDKQEKLDNAKKTTIGKRDYLFCKGVFKSKEIEKIRQWCLENNLEIKHEEEEQAGITCIAQKK